MDEVLKSPKSQSASFGGRPKARYKSGSPEETENESIHPAAQSANVISRKAHRSGGISRCCWSPHCNELSLTEAVVRTGNDADSELEFKGVIVVSGSELLEVSADGSADKPGVLLPELVDIVLVKAEDI